MVMDDEPKSTQLRQDGSPPGQQPEVGGEGGWQDAPPQREGAGEFGQGAEGAEEVGGIGEGRDGSGPSAGIGEKASGNGTDVPTEAPPPPPLPPEEVPQEVPKEEPPTHEAAIGGRETPATLLSPKEVDSLEVSGEVVIHSGKFKVGELAKLRVGSLVEIDADDLNRSRLVVAGGLFAEGEMVRPREAENKVALKITKLVDKD